MNHQQFVEVFGVSLPALLAYAGLHLHLFIIGRRVTRVEKTPTVARELRTVTTPTK